MKDMYVVMDIECYPDRLFYNEAPGSYDDEIMNLEDAVYTAKHLGAKIYKLVEIEELYK